MLLVEETVSNVEHIEKQGARLKISLSKLKAYTKL
jgi:hypothetical protein